MKNSFAILILSALIFTSCQKDINLDLPVQPARLGVHAIWNRGQALEVQVTRSFALQETPQTGYQGNPPTMEQKLRDYGVPHAKVVVYKDGVLFDELVFDPVTYLYKTSSGKTATPGARYHLTVEASGFARVSAPVTAFPEQVPIKSIVVKKQVANDGMGGSVDEVSIEFDDPASVKNYYWINIQRNIRNSGGQHYYFPTIVYPVTNEVIVPSGSDLSTDMPAIDGGRILLKDDNFNGQSKRVVIRMSSWVLAYSASEPVTLSLNNVNEDLFNYVRSRLLDVPNPFSTPVQAYSNITNGLGIFSLFTGEERELQ